MRFGVFLPPFADFAEPGRVVTLARRAEESGWDGVFLWDHMLAAPGMAVADPWVTMAALAAATTRIRLGALVTVATLQGCFPIYRNTGPPPPPDPEDIGTLRAALIDLGAAPTIHIAVRCALSLENPASVPDTVGALAESGVTWMLEAVLPGAPPDEVMAVVSRGPPATR